MKRLWTVVLPNGSMRGSPIFGRDQAIDVACELIAKGEPISHICPVAIEHDGDIIKADHLRMIAAGRTRARAHP
jgi:hypothetical protein